MASNLFGDMLTDLGGVHQRRPGPAPQHEHQSRAAVPVDVRAGARLGPGHRRPGHRQPDRRDPQRGDDARSPRPAERRRIASAPPSKRRWRKASQTRDLGGTFRTTKWGTQCGVGFSRQIGRRRAGFGVLVLLVLNLDSLSSVLRPLASTHSARRASSARGGRGPRRVLASALSGRSWRSALRLDAVTASRLLRGTGANDASRAELLRLLRDERRDERAGAVACLRPTFRLGAAERLAAAGAAGGLAAAADSLAL